MISVEVKNGSLLDVQNLNVTYKSTMFHVDAVKDVSITMNKGECIAIVGESGSGKSTLAMAVMKLLPPYATVTADKIMFNGVDILKVSDKELAKIRGKDVTVIFQDPISYLNPIISVGDQMIESLSSHNDKITKKEAYEQAIDLLKKVRIADPERILKMYPFQLSGGMAQRVFIAMAVSANPKLLIADEPTTALDLTIQAQILKLLNSLRKEFNLSIMLITHDLGLASYIADRIYVMFNGKVVEEDLAEGIFSQPVHPYTQMLIASSQAIYHGRTRELSKTISDMGKMEKGKKACDFADRCDKSSEACYNEPQLVKYDGTKKVRCWLVE